MSGLIAFLVVVALGLAVYLLGRSLAKHLRRVPASFDSPADDPASSPATTAGQRPARPRP